MVRHMDEGIGRILAALAATGAADNTLVVFTSDNGGERYSDTWPLVGKKMDLLEGGIRVPYIVRWPGRVPRGRTSAQLAITMDWVATFLEAAGVAPHPDYALDGISLVPVLDDPGTRIERDLYWRMKFRNQKAMRSGDWKYLVARRRRVPVRSLGRPARAREPRPARAGTPGGDAGALCDVGGGDTAAARRRHVLDPVHQGGPGAAVLTRRSGDVG